MVPRWYGSVVWNTKVVPRWLATPFATFRNALTRLWEAHLEHRLRVSHNVRRVKTIWWLFGERETTTSVVSDEKKVRAARRIYQKC